MGMTLKNKVAIRGYLTVNDLEPGEVFVFNGDDKIYMMTDHYDRYFVHLPSGDLVEDPWDSDWCSKPVTTINVDLIIK